VSNGSNSSFSNKSDSETVVLKEFKIYGNSVQNGIPSSENPVEIKSVGNLSKNIYNMPPFGVYTLQEDGSYSVTLKQLHGKNFICSVTDNLTKQYTFSAKIKGAITSNNSYGYVSMYFTYDDGSTSSSVKFNESELNDDEYIFKSITSTSEKKVSSAMFSYRGSGTVNVKEIQLEEGTTATSYEPHYAGYKIPIVIETDGETYPINIYLDEPLRKVGNVADYIDLISGKVYRNVQVNDATGTKSIEESYAAVTDTTGTSISIPSLPQMNGPTNVVVGTQISSNVTFDIVY